MSSEKSYWSKKMTGISPKKNIVGQRFVGEDDWTLAGAANIVKAAKYDGNLL